MERNKEMLTFKEYQAKIKQYNDAIEEIKLKIRYRKIELRGPEKISSVTVRDYFATSACINLTGSISESSRTDEILNNDRELADLKLTLETLETELKYIESRAEVPTYIYDIPKTEDWPKPKE